MHDHFLPSTLAIHQMSRMMLTVRRTSSRFLDSQFLDNLNAPWILLVLLSTTTAMINIGTTSLTSKISCPPVLRPSKVDTIHETSVDVRGYSMIH